MSKKYKSYQSHVTTHTFLLTLGRIYFRATKNLLSRIFHHTPLFIEQKQFLNR